MATHPIRLQLPEGGIEALIETPDGPHRLVDLAFQVVGLSSVVAEMGEKAAARNGKPASCSKGCDACCWHLIQVSPPEAVFLSELVESMDEPRKSVVKKRFSRTIERLEKTGLLKKLEDPDDPLLKQAEEQYFLSRIPCPFLENRSCIIYESRPSRCREYMVFTPPENCADPYRNQIGMLPVSIRMSEGLTWLWASMTKEKPKYVPLVLSLKWAGENPATRSIGADPKRMIEVLCKLTENIAANVEREALQKKDGSSHVTEA